jgi:hypothetical protein
VRALDLQRVEHGERVARELRRRVRPRVSVALRRSRGCRTSRPGALREQRRRPVPSRAPVAEPLDHQQRLAEPSTSYAR